jgi:hypothetical protein
MAAHLNNTHAISDKEKINQILAECDFNEEHNNHNDNVPKQLQASQADMA